jgi:uncharacterized protein (UPF0333 family)
MKKNKGQVVVEYMLMLAVLVAIITSILALIKKRYIGDPRKCLTPANQATISCKLNSFMDPGTGGGDKRFQYYPYKK